MTVRRMALDVAAALFALGVAALATGLAYLGGWALARVIESARALRVPLPTCATQKRHDVLSRPEAGRTTVSSARQVSRTGHHPGALERATLRPPLPQQPPGQAGCLVCPWQVTHVRSYGEAVALVDAHVLVAHGGQP